MASRLRRPWTGPQKPRQNTSPGGQGKSPKGSHQLAQLFFKTPAQKDKRSKSTIFTEVVAAQGLEFEDSQESQESFVMTQLSQKDKATIVETVGQSIKETRDKYSVPLLVDLTGAEGEDYTKTMDMANPETLAFLEDILRFKEEAKQSSFLESIKDWNLIENPFRWQLPFLCDGLVPVGKI